MFDGISGLNQSYTTCWINSTNSYGHFQLSKFWNDGTYRTTIPSYATVIYYGMGGDHSAISKEVGVSGRRYISKWGQLPLVRHLPTDCPYNSSNLSYYTRRPVSAYVTGEDFIVTGQAYTYRLHCPEVSFTNVVWEIEGVHDIPESYYNIVSSGSTATITFNHCGEYYLSANVYSGNTLLVHSDGPTILAINQ